MAKATSKRLKVFFAPFGFHDSVVAAPSQAAALRAWGTHQNLFAEGRARLSTDDAEIKAALQHPETPLRRAVGSKGLFELVPSSLPVLPVEQREKPKKPSKPGKIAAAAKPPADRTELDRAEQALRALERDREREVADLDRRRKDLGDDVEAAKLAYAKAKKIASDALTSAASAYRKDGGKF